MTSSPFIKGDGEGFCIIQSMLFSWWERVRVKSPESVKVKKTLVLRVEKDCLREAAPAKAGDKGDKV
jgi:hypothetical protein